ncbi:MAG: DNA-protecting protein DprA [Gammaproteobacteria bacterium]|nr:MAG: DNA-protecting protein DprA [Gammaproteobacteria bacterium]
MDDRRDWLVLARTPNLGPCTLRKLLAEFGDPASVRAADRNRLRSHLGDGGIRFLRQPDPASLDRDLDWLSRPDRYLLTLDDPDYPPLLKRLDDAPGILFVEGDPTTLWQAQIAIVGSRTPTAAGLDNARTFARHLSSAGFAITSGLALGIDAAAHAAALDCGGRSNAVFGTGPDQCYPRRNAPLADRIAASGAIVSEFPVGTSPRRGNFPRRNRIISGLSLGTLVIEAGVRSGSLITARLAGEQNREVFAVPGSIHNPLARGCHRLIRQGAKLVETCEDVVEELEPLAVELAMELKNRLETDTGPPARRDNAQLREAAKLDPDYCKLIDALGFDPVPFDTLVERTGLTTDVVSSMLLMLELKGMVSTPGGGRYLLTAEISE